MELNQMLNKIYVGIDASKYGKIKEVFILDNHSVCLYRYQDSKNQPAELTAELKKLAKNKEVVTYCNSVNHLFQDLGIKSETFIQWHVKDLFCNYDFLTNENNIVENAYTDNIKAVLDVFSSIFGIHFEPIYITDFDVKSKLWEKEYFDNNAFFEAFYLIRLYQYFYEVQDRKTELLPYKPVKPEKTVNPTDFDNIFKKKQ